MASTPAVPTKKPFTPRKEFCPTCYFEGKPDATLEYRPGRFEYYCSAGHVFSDLDELKAGLQKMNAKRRPVQEAPPVPPAQPPVNKPAEMGINPIDHARLQELLEQPITDSSVLCGAVWALRQQRDEAKAKAEALTLSSVPDAKRGGDVRIQIWIPEAWVTPLKDVAEAGGSTIERHMQAMIEDGLVNGWYA